MSPRHIAGLLILSAILSSSASASRADAQSPADVTPPRVSYLYGEVSFWRPGAPDWTPAKINTPLAPGDVLSTGPGGNVELQVGPKAFVRAAENTQLGLTNHEPDFLQLRVSGGHVALDLSEIPSGFTVELDTPNAAFTVERAGFYRLDVAQDSTAFHTHRGGVATMTLSGGAGTPIATNQQLIVTGTDAPRVETTTAPELSAWDRWNDQRTAYLLRPASTGHVPADMYGADALEQHGTWRTVETYGPVWVPSGVPATWVPYGTGRWIWDPRFGWTWLDDAPWGWAPYQYGRWVFVGGSWAWAPGPVRIRPVYSPALVVFLDGGGRAGVGARKLCWAPLAWGEPLIPWWGRPGFVGVASWRGWGGPRVVNNVVVNRTTTVNVTHITVYRNVAVTNAVVGVPADRFGRHHERPRRIADAEVRRLTPVHGALDVTPVPASMTVSRRGATRPPAALETRGAVATRRRHDTTPTVRAQGIAAPTHAPEPAITPPSVSAPRSQRTRERAAVPHTRNAGGERHPTPAAPPMQQSPASQHMAPPPSRVERPERGQPQTAPAPQRPSTPAARNEPAPSRREHVQLGVPAPQPMAAPPQRSAPQQAAPQQAMPRHQHATSTQRHVVPPSPSRGERQERGQPPTAPVPQRQSAPVGPQPPPSARTEPAPHRGERGEPQRRTERQQRAERQGRGER